VRWRGDGATSKRSVCRERKREDSPQAKMSIQSREFRDGKRTERADLVLDSDSFLKLIQLPKYPSLSFHLDRHPDISKEDSLSAP